MVKASNYIFIWKKCDVDESILAVEMAEADSYCCRRMRFSRLRMGDPITRADAGGRLSGVCVLLLALADRDMDHGGSCYVVLVFAWKIAGNIRKNRSFSMENAKSLKWIAVLAAADTGFFFVMNIVYLFLNMNHPGIVLASLGVLVIGIAISAVSATLSHLVRKAADLQEQSDLTI